MKSLLNLLNKWVAILTELPSKKVGLKKTTKILLALSIIRVADMKTS